MGRYIESDPIGLIGGLNSYAYARLSPMLWIDPMGLCQPGEKMKKCLDKTFGGGTNDVTITRDDDFVQWHLGKDENGAAVRGATTRSGKIFINMPCDTFFSDPLFVLHEYYHVVQQWGREGMTIPGYLIFSGRREREAWDFAKQNVEKFKGCLSCDPIK